MALRSQKVMMVFEGVPELAAFEARSGYRPHRVNSPLAAARDLVHLRPELIVIRSDVAWQRELVRRLPAHQRPVVLAVGRCTGATTAIDEWLGEAPSETEAVTRLQLATARARERRRLARRASVDVLTGLPNRRAFIRAFAGEAARSRRASSPLSLLLIDLDDFKQVNETRGHAGGDALLKKVGQVLRTRTRGGEVCGRIGGDAFAVIVNAEASAAKRARRRLWGALQRIGVSASIALGSLQPGEPPRALYRRTDTQLSEMKARRRLVPPTPRELVLDVHPEHAVPPRVHFKKEEVHVLGMQ